MPRSTEQHLTRRERQIMDVVYRRKGGGGAAVSEVIEELPDPPSYSAVRALMNILKDKGHLRTEREGVRYVYFPTRARRAAARSALRRTVSTFFDDSPEKAVAALLDMSALDLGDEELDRLAERIEEARSQRAEGRGQRAEKQRAGLMGEGFEPET